MLIRYYVWLLCLVATASILAGALYISLFFLIPALPLAILSALGIYDVLQRSHSLWRNYPVTAHMRWLLEDLRPYLRQYIVEDDLSGRPFNRNERGLVYARSKEQEDYHPFGTDLDVYSKQHEWITQTISPYETSEDDIRVTIGGPQCKKPYSASILNISAMSFGSLGERAIEALNMGAKIGGFYHDTGEGAISAYHEKHGGDLVWELGTGYFGCRTKDGKFDPDEFAKRVKSDQVKMIEIKLSQGAKPGHGGVLPAEKVTKEIAEIRGLEVGQDAISPSGHSNFSTPIQLLNWVGQLRELSGGKPIGIKLCVGKPHEVFAIIKAMQQTEIMVDFIVVDGAEGGTGAAPQEFSDHLGMPLREGLIIVRNALVGSGLKKHISLGASGKVHSAFSVASNCAVGADWCNAARAFMFAVGCVQSMKCHTGECPTGVATQDAGRQRGLDIPDKAERVEKFHKRTVDTLKELLAAAGFVHTKELRPCHLYHRIGPVEIRTIDEVFPFLSENELGDDMKDPLYRRWWRMADAQSFHAIREIA